MTIEDMVDAAKVEHRRFWRATSDESTGDKGATVVTRAWQIRVASKDIQCEVAIGEGFNDKIHVVDFSAATAYEMKVSGKNAGHEFYKDIFKVLTCNQHHAKKLGRFVFITQQFAADELNKGLGRAVTELLTEHGIRVTVEGI